MDIRMLVIDLDGTLLHSDKTLSARSAEVLQHCREKGIKTVFASARPLRDILPYRDIFDPDAIIFHTGAGVYQNGASNIIGAIPADDGNAVLQKILAKYPDAKLCAEIGNDFYSNFDAHILWPFTKYAFDDFSKPFDCGFYKIILYTADLGCFDDICALLPETAYARTAENRLILIMPKNITKLCGVELLCSRWDIPIEKTAAFGDDHIDLDILTHCGIGVAVKNAIPEAVSAADFVTASNDEDGVALWLEENIL